MGKIKSKARNKSSVGIVFDVSEVRALELLREDKKLKIVAFAVSELPEGLVVDGLITNITLMSTIVKDMLAKNGFSKAGWIIGGKNQNILMRMSTFPNIAPDKLRNMVMFQAQHIMPIATSELVLDYVTCDTFQEENREMINILLVGAKKAFVKNCFDIAKECGRTIEDIDSALLASLRGVTNTINSNEVILVANVDNETVGMIICKEETIMMARTVSISTEAMNEIKNYKHPRVMQSAIGGVSQGDNDLEESYYTNLATQIEGNLRASMSYFATQRTAPIEKIILTGTISNLEAIEREIGQEFYIPIETTVLHPDMLDKTMQSYASCLSLAMRGVEA